MADPVLHILPHGVFEIPALPIAASYGLWLGITPWKVPIGEERLVTERIRHAVGVFFMIVFPLFIIAAAILTALIVWL